MGVKNFLAWSLRLEAFKKLLAAAQVTGRQCAMIISKPWQQVIVFNSFHLFFSSSPDLLSLVSGSLPAHLLFFSIVLCPYYSFLNSSYSIPDPLSSLKLAAWSLKLFLIFILTHYKLLATCNEQNLARCIGRPHGADFFSLFLIPGPYSSQPHWDLLLATNNMDQGSVRWTLGEFEILPSS